MSRKRGLSADKTLRRVPAYRKHSSGQAFVEYKGKRKYLGRYGTPKSLDKYKQFLSQLEAMPESIMVAAESNSNLMDLAAAYLDHCKGYYVDRAGRPNAEYRANVDALRPLLELYGSESARAIGPRWLIALQSKYIQLDYARTTVNHHIQRIKRFVKWCSSREFIPPATYHGLLCVEGIRAGKSAVRESEPVRPVKWDQVEAVLRFTSPVVAAMIQVQWLCGMRPAEVCAIRLVDIDRSGEIWLYTPPQHKNAWRGHRLTKAIPKRAQAILSPFLERDPNKYLFSPIEAERWRQDQAAANAGIDRRTKVYPCETRRRRAQREATKRRTPRQRDCYQTNSYARAIGYAIEKAKKNGVAVEHWSPNQLRHGISTEIARLLGQQKAQRWLGHADLETTSIYTEITTEELVEIAKELDARWSCKQEINVQ